MSSKGCRLTKKQEEELQEAFIINDTDDDKRVNKDQAAMVMRSVGISPTRAELNEMLGERDDRQFTLQDLHTIITTRAPPIETEERLCDALRIFDKDGNGFIDAKELRHVLVHLGEKLTDEEVDQMIRAADITGDNQINYADLAKMICREFS